MKNSSVHPTRKTYVTIFGWLALLTLLELAAVAVGLPKGALIVFLIGTALAKALLIALYFMDLKFEGRLVWLLPGIPVVFAVIFITALFPDIVLHLTFKM
jgi:caa(3)-type oxidase subunit IV